MTTAIEFISEGIELRELIGPKPEVSNDSFSNWFAKEVNFLNNQIQGAEVLVQQMAAGENDNLHQVMISLEKAKLSFELVVQVRNKLLEGYQDIMKMQV